jgi:hypothetical protein
MKTLCIFLCLLLGNKSVNETPPAGQSTKNIISESVNCEGVYQGHLQGVCTNHKDAIYWSFTTSLVKSDLKGRVINKIPVDSHHGDLCFYNNKIYVAVNLGKFNQPPGQADSWVYIYDAESLDELSKQKVPELVHGAGGMACDGKRFIIVGGLPEGYNENYLYEYGLDLKYKRRHEIPGYTLLGIQTAAFSDKHWWFGCYGSPQVTLKTNQRFKLKGKWTFDSSLGIERLSGDKLLVGKGNCQKDVGCTGKVVIAEPDKTNGLRILNNQK